MLMSKLNKLIKYILNFYIWFMCFFVISVIIILVSLFYFHLILDLIWTFNITDFFPDIYDFRKKAENFPGICAYRGRKQSN